MNLLPRLTASRGRTLRQTAERLGLVYFGGVDHNQDEHDAVRGLTVSTTHRDKHFAVGTYDGYDIAIVDRYDTTKLPGAKTVTHNWAILQVSLAPRQHLPHLFFLPLHRESTFAHLFTSTRQLAPARQYLTGTFPLEFASRYQLYVRPSDAATLDQDLLQKLLPQLAAYFWPHAVEMQDNKIFVYLIEHRLDEAVLQSAIQSALWLAELVENHTD